MSTISTVRVENLHKTYGEGQVQTKALQGISVSVNKGEFVAIVGTSGSGKSTLLHILGGIDSPTEGKVYIDGTEISDLKGNDLIKFRREKIGYIFQDFNLVPILTVKENICLPAGLAGKKVDKDYYKRIITALELKEKEDVYPNELSGGQQQRVAIARALINKPEIILADEPTGNLDKANSNNVIKLLKKINSEYGQTIILITHDQNVASEADRILQIEDGRLADEHNAY